MRRRKTKTVTRSVLHEAAEAMAGPLAGWDLMLASGPEIMAQVAAQEACQKKLQPFPARRPRSLKENAGQPALLPAA